MSPRRPSKRVKRDTRTSDTPNSPAVPSPSSASPPSHPTAGLCKWLDRRANTVIFPIRSSSARSGAKNLLHDTLVLNGITYAQVAYTMNFNDRWRQLRSYRKCAVIEETIQTGQCVLVRTDTTSKQSTDDIDHSQWKAQVHEIRALDEDHVYARVSWLYRPQFDLPDGPLAYHAKCELIPSTEMTIIDARSIDGILDLKRWDEHADEDVPTEDEYFWRQSYDHVTRQLSPCRTICICEQPQNPDQPILQCNHCKKWLHVACLEQAALKPAEQDDVSDSITLRAPVTENVADRNDSGIDDPPDVSASILFEERDGAESHADQTKPTMVIKRKEHQSIVKDIVCLHCEKVIDG